MSKALNRGSDTRIQEGIRIVETRRAALVSQRLINISS